MSLTLLTDHFADIEDPRQASKVTYELFDVLFLTLTAVISGAEGWEEIEDFGHPVFFKLVVTIRPFKQPAFVPVSPALLPG
ncbi:DDE family transposase [Aliidiomarina maris]|uniref:DDE family transposase n=1 Tax=Aliidiomarina maris TaxID=531312 RepID=A0A327X0T4_9GAMM|nr:DDE family transposase [Aliidiomarina maris]